MDDYVINTICVCVGRITQNVMGGLS